MKCGQAGDLPDKFTSTDAQEVEKFTSFVHDEFFEIADIKHHPDRDLVEIPFRRIFHGRKPEVLLKKGLFSNLYQVDVLRAVIRIGHAIKFDITDKAELGTYSFNEVNYDAERKLIVFTCSEPCEVRVEVSDIDLHYEVLDYRGTARIRRGPLFMESYTGKVYD